MPAFTINTNVTVEEPVGAEIMEEITVIIAETLGKPRSYIMVQINGGKQMIWGGSDEPCANCSLCSVGKINKENNTIVSDKVSKLLENKLKISPTRYYINFFDEERQNVGYNRTVF